MRHYFDASHQLPNTKHLATKKCANLHGHTYAVEIEIFDAENNKAGMIIDFKMIKDAIDILDHKHINDIFKKENFKKEATAENIAIFIHTKLKKLLADRKIENSELVVKINEGYKGEDKGAWVIYF